MINIDAYWMRCNNFGDKLTPYLIKKISGCHSITYHPNVNDHITRYICVGSILNHANSNDIVWGAGSAYRTSDKSHLKINPNCDIRSIRGPISREWAKLCGNKNVPEIYGDPAMLLPKFYKPNVVKKYKLGVIPHVVEYKYSRPINDEITVIDLRGGVEDVIDKINECENIISSSLHGLIVADAYNIPSKWVKFTNKIGGDDTKYLDHYASIGVNCKNSYNLDITKIDIKIIDKIERYDIIFDKGKLLDVCPFNKT